MQNNKLFFFEELSFDETNKIIILDIDGTLVADLKDCCDDKVIDKINYILEKNEIYLSTNSRNNKRNLKIQETLNLPFTNLLYKKPNKKVIDNISNPSKNFLVIGDKFLTDFILAKRINSDFIWVKRKIDGKERLIIKIINLIDDISYFVYRL